jgi:hypothetical protein
MLALVASAINLTGNRNNPDEDFNFYHLAGSIIFSFSLPIMQTKFNARYDESVWIVRKAASILSWPLPKSM